MPTKTSYLSCEAFITKITFEWSLAAVRYKTGTTQAKI